MCVGCTHDAESSGSHAHRGSPSDDTVHLVHIRRIADATARPRSGGRVALPAPYPVLAWHNLTAVDYVPPVAHAVGEIVELVRMPLGSEQPMFNPMLRLGDLIVAGPSGVPLVLPPGPENSVLTIVDGRPQWV